MAKISTVTVTTASGVQAVTGECHYRGAEMFHTADATGVVYKGTAATAGNEIGFLGVEAAAEDTDRNILHNDEIDCPEGIYVNISAGSAIIFFER